MTSLLPRAENDGPRPYTTSSRSHPSPALHTILSSMWSIWSPLFPHTSESINHGVRRTSPLLAAEQLRSLQLSLSAYCALYDQVA